MSQININTTPNKKLVNPRKGLAFASSFFVFAIILFFRPQYFGSFTLLISILFVIIGFMALGLELDRLNSQKATLADEFVRGAEIFNHIGIGIGMVAFWGVLHYFFDYILLNILLSYLLFMGVSFVLVGVINFIFDIYLSKQDLDAQQISINATTEKKEDLLRYNTAKYWLVIKNIFITIGGFVGFLASLLTILQIMRIIN